VIAAADERARPPAGETFADAVTFAWADAERGWYGLARLGLSSRGASVLAVLFRGAEPVAAVARGGIEVPEGADWSELAAGPLRTRVEEPLTRWHVAWEGDEASVALDFEAISPPAELPEGDPAAQLGGMAGYEQVCRVSGTVRFGGEDVPVEGLGQRGHAWGAPDWERLELARTIGAWVDDGDGLALQSVRPSGAAGHDAEAMWAVLLSGGEAVRVADPRLSTTYDGEGRQRRAGLELWIGDEDEADEDDPAAYPVRATGEVLCGSTLDLGGLRLDCAFFRWHIDGREGVGRYDVLRRA
jgi:hypothetical protein